MRRGLKRSVKQTYEPMYKNRMRGIRCRTSEQTSAKSISIKGTGCKSGGCVRKAVKFTTGDLPCCSGIGTEGGAIQPDRAAEVSRGRSSRENDEGPNGPRKGLMGAASRRRNS